MRAIVPKVLFAAVLVHFVGCIASCDRLRVWGSSAPSSGAVAGASGSGLVELNGVRYSFYLSLDGFDGHEFVDCFIGIIGGESSSWRHANEICTIDDSVSFSVPAGMAVLVKYDPSNRTIERIAEIVAPGMNFTLEDPGWAGEYARKCLDELLVEASGSS